MQVLSSEIDKVELAVQELARHSFMAFRFYMHPQLKRTEFQTQIASELASWYDGYLAGDRPNLVINTPPQHGKSCTMMDWCAWCMGRDPTTRIIYASFSERLAIRANLAVQRIMLSDKYRAVFPEAALAPQRDSLSNRNRTIIETRAGGYFRNTTVRGSITGESLDIGIIDDPIKGREAANSQVIRDNTWEWFTDDWLTRFSDHGAMVSIATRWHVDDPIGRMLEFDKSARCLVYAAIAEKDEGWRKAGEPLAPELKPLDFLLERKRILSTESWESLYQQHPIITGGNIIKSACFKRYDVLPPLKYMRIFVDTASKVKTMNDYTVFGLYGVGVDGGLYLVDLLRGKWEYTPMKQRAVDFWYKATSYMNPDKNSIPVRDLVVEDKSAGIQLIQDLRLQQQVPVTPVQRNTDKYTRLQNVIGYINSGYVHLPNRAHFTSDFVSECEAFTGLGDTHDDQVDTLIDALQFMLAEEESDLVAWEHWL